MRIDGYEESPNSDSLTACEADLLVACSRVAISTPQAARIRELAASGTVDWERLRNAARLHCVTQLLYRGLKNCCPEIVPHDAMEHLRGAYECGVQSNLLFAAELKKLVAVLKARGIPCAAFKGPVLATEIYGSLALRLFGDLDVLVRLRDIEPATKALNELGYVHEYHLTAAEEAAYIRLEHAFHFVHQLDSRVVEVHWRLSHRDLMFDIDGTGLWSRLKPVRFMGIDVMSLDDADLFLYLCMHGAKHAWERLEWICSISEMVHRKPDLDWDGIVRRARKLGARRLCALALHLAGDILDDSQARMLSEKFGADPIVAPLSAKVRERLFAPKLSHRDQEVYRRMLYLQARERLRDRVMGVVYSCIRTPHPISQDRKVYRLPSRLTFLYYLLRPLRLAREHGFGWLRTVLRPAPTQAQKMN